jgi:predicted nucleotidyltransferase
MKDRGRTMSPTEEKIAEIVKRIVTGFDPIRIILFGSLARGEAGPDSDVDLLVVLDVPRELKRETAVRIDCSLLGIDLPVDIVVATPSEVEKYAKLIGSVILAALREGKVVYEKAA